MQKDEIIIGREGKKQKEAQPLIKLHAIHNRESGLIRADSEALSVKLRFVPFAQLYTEE